MKILITILCALALLAGCGGKLVDNDQLAEREGVWYFKKAPFTGRAASKFENGQKKEEATYKAGKREGLETWWYENGQKRAQGTIRDGKKQGPFTEWYENGQKKEETTYNNDGKRDGPYTTWHENGQMWRKSFYEDGKEISKKQWGSDGNQIIPTP